MLEEDSDEANSPEPINPNQGEDMFDALLKEKRSPNEKNEEIGEAARDETPSERFRTKQEDVDGHPRQKSPRLHEEEVVSDGEMSDEDLMERFARLKQASSNVDMQTLINNFLSSDEGTIDLSENQALAREAVQRALTLLEESSVNSSRQRLLTMLTVPDSNTEYRLDSDTDIDVMMQSKW